jgi:hypothetical protein
LNSKFDGLQIEWGKRNFINPPFSEVIPWFKKAIEEKKENKMSVFLVPVRDDTFYWHDLILPNASEIRLIRGRVQFKGYDKKLLVALCVIVFDPSTKRKRKSKHINTGHYEMFPIVLN